MHRRKISAPRGIQIQQPSNAVIHKSKAFHYLPRLISKTTIVSRLDHDQKPKICVGDARVGVEVKLEISWLY